MIVTSEDQPGSQVFNCALEDIFICFETSYNLLGPLILAMEVIESPFH